MGTVFAILVGLFFAAGIYLILSRHIVRILLGVVLFGKAVDLLVFADDRIAQEVPPIIAECFNVPVSAMANPLLRH